LILHPSELPLNPLPSPARKTLAATAQRHYVKNTANNILQQTNKTSTFSGTLQKGEAPTALLQRA
jgi:hypothetical protein